MLKQSIKTLTIVSAILLTFIVMDAMANPTTQNLNVILTK